MKLKISRLILNYRQNNEIKASAMRSPTPTTSMVPAIIERPVCRKLMYCIWLSRVRTAFARFY